MPRGGGYVVVAWLLYPFSYRDIFIFCNFIFDSCLYLGTLPPMNGPTTIEKALKSAASLSFSTHYPVFVYSDNCGIRFLHNEFRVPFVSRSIAVFRSGKDLMQWGTHRLYTPALEKRYKGRKDQRIERFN